VYFGDTFCPPPRERVVLDFSTPHRVPLTWLAHHGSEAIRLRAARELAPLGYEADLDALTQAVAESKLAAAVVKKQDDEGIWGGNLLGLAPSAKDGVKDVGTIAQYRRLVELGYPAEGRPFKLADRQFFRILSRDPDPALLFEHQKLVKAAPGAEEWVRDLEREAATAALAEAGYVEDPRVRGSAHRIATAVSQFLRSPLADNPIVRSGGANVLHEEAHPPTWYSLAMVAAMPNLQRERAGFMERLGQYLAKAETRKSYTISVGRRKLKPAHVLLGDPMHADARGHVKDLPLALHFIELMARIGAAASSPAVEKVLHRLYADCDEGGVWRPGISSAPRAVSPVSYHFYPLHPDNKTVDGRVVDVTFRLARIARLMGRPLEYV
jgi:hypothetical protein